MRPRTSRTIIKTLCQSARPAPGNPDHNRVWIRCQSTSSSKNTELRPPQDYGKQPRTLTYDEIVELQNTPTPPLKARDPAKNPPVLAIFFASIIGIPPLVYYYWQYREEHMKQKKFAMLKDIQARAGNAG
ncbi:hypothetical protein BDZ85DRAFT_279339 [Elsinoe ampelina]|uniref:Uncharacterized protein n=1 Tax=Elsinoe ampelina TaxID=302913 RepID=A0A6A6GJK4_9PEZI|nr:hypothetical protein BDZ85DRAFT_279339 [Elsinoe ampelina]